MIPTRAVANEGQLNQCLEPVTVILPLLAQQVGIKINGPLKVVRSDKTSKQGTSGDCGVFVIKYIEFLSAGQEINLVNSHHMLMWREKLAADIYAFNYDP
ncbi:hypothetical protein DH2020_047626 [Rehmannia glutinosa]|uniref:Ubiquitin-like protease family profile domain-containing protein n=1 Tax=Rehmannia glutinosa TaxID=99300 RepID=A0ABR0U8J6_REHGL